MVEVCFAWLSLCDSFHSICEQSSAISEHLEAKSLHRRPNLTKRTMHTGSLCQNLSPFVWCRSCWEKRDSPLGAKIICYVHFNRTIIRVIPQITLEIFLAAQTYADIFQLQLGCRGAIKSQHIFGNTNPKKAI